MERTLPQEPRLRLQLQSMIMIMIMLAARSPRSLARSLVSPTNASSSCCFFQVPHGVEESRRLYEKKKKICASTLYSPIRNKAVAS